MAYITIDNFSYGLDRRRSRFAGTPGSLWLLENAHITRGGEIERCKRFVSKYALPNNTFGMLAVGTTLYVFGSVSTPVGIPAGVTYQRLQHPDGSTVMSSILDAKPFDGKAYVVAKFADSRIFHYYDGVRVTDWDGGAVLSYMASTTGIATYLKNLINADTGGSWTATSSSNVVTVTGADYESWTYTASAKNGGSVGDEALTANKTQSAVAGTAETLASFTTAVSSGAAATPATGTVTLTGGAAGSVNSITVNGVDILGSAVNFNASLNQTASDVANRINSYTSSPDYAASAVGAVITISAATSAGAGPNGFVVAANTTTIIATTADMSGGADSGVSSIKIDGVEILGSTINMDGSYSSFASAVAAAITAYTSSPDYSAVSSVQNLTIRAPTGSGSGANGRAVAITTVGTVTMLPASGPLAGGVTATTGQAQIVTFTVGGTFDPGDKFTIKLTKGLRTKVFGYNGSPEPVGTILLPFKTKMHAASGSLVNFSAAQNATVWNRDNIETALAGQGFINAASQDEGSQDITALQLYHGELAIYTRFSIQLWAIAADPAANTFLQTLPNTGTRAPKSALAYGNNDSFYLDDTGIRSLRARDSSNAAYVNDVGTAIDTLVQEHLRSLTDAQIAASSGAIDPLDARYWLAVNDKIYVFSYFPGSKINAWSTYSPGMVISDFARIGNKLYARSGNVIYLYGGDTGTTYPNDNEQNVTVETPFMSAAKIATFKKFNGFDIGCTNEWDCRLMYNMNDPTLMHKIGVFNRSTFNRPSNGVHVDTTHVALKMTCARGGYASIANAALHFDDLHGAG